MDDYSKSSNASDAQMNDVLRDLDGMNIAQYIYDHGLNADEMNVINQQVMSTDKKSLSNLHEGDKSSNAYSQSELGIISEELTSFDLETQMQFHAALNTQQLQHGQQEIHLQQQQPSQTQSQFSSQRQPQSHLLHQLPTPIGSDEYQMGENTFMSPLDMPEMPPSGGFITDGYDDDDLLFTPLMSPAVTPAEPFFQLQSQQIMRNLASNTETFPPLTSPALSPSVDHQHTQVAPLALTAQAKQAGRKKRGCLDTSRSSRTRPSPLLKAQSARRRVARSNVTIDDLKDMVGNHDKQGSPINDTSPSGNMTPVTALTTMPPPPVPSIKTSSNRNFSPVTPGSLMNMPAKILQQVTTATSRSPVIIPGLNSPQIHSPISRAMNMNVASPNLVKRDNRRSSSIASIASPALDAVISPSLKPILPSALSADAIVRLASKSNYQNILEGDSQALGLHYNSDIHSDLASRRHSHKAAEQKRRDSLKVCFDELRSVLPAEVERGASKVLLLKKSHDYIIKLHNTISTKDQIIAKLLERIKNLKARLGEDDSESGQETETVMQPQET